jgi:hypothetical protein
MELSVTEVRDGLRVRTERKPSVAEAMMSSAATGGFEAFAASNFVGKGETIALATLTAKAAYWGGNRTRRFDLRVTRKEFVARGKVGDGLGSIRTVCAADTLWIEYQESGSRRESAQHPKGLYAVVRHRNICILPGIEFEQTNALIERIKDRFPDFREQWVANSPFGTHLISLGLKEPNRAGRQGWNGRPSLRSDLSCTNGKSGRGPRSENAQRLVLYIREVQLRGASIRGMVWFEPEVDVAWWGGYCHCI